MRKSGRTLKKIAKDIRYLRENSFRKILEKL